MLKRVKQATLAYISPATTTYTVFAVYEDNLQPYSTTISASSPESAVYMARMECLAANGADLVAPGDFGACTLVGIQVVEGKVETIPFSGDMRAVPDRRKTQRAAS